MSESLRIRAETPAEHAHVFALQEAAFGRRAEAELVRALRSSVAPGLSLVAELGDALVGHVFFSPVVIAEGAVPAAGLAPLGVLPEHQGCGIGSALVRRGLAECARLGFRAVFLVGDPDYYARFGFELAAPRDLHYASAGFEPVFQVRELAPGALTGCRGRVVFPAAFDAVA